MWRVVPVVCVAALALAMPAGFAAGGGGTRLTPRSPSTQQDAVTPLTGSASTLIFSRQPGLARDVNFAETSPHYPSGTDTLYARSASGHLVSLGAAPASAWGYSLVGSVLAAASADTEDFPTAHSADVWNTKTGKRRVIALGAQNDYLAAAAGGVIYSTPSGAVMVKSLAGPSHLLARPFGANHTPRVVLGASDSAGVVVSDTAGHIAFIKFAAPHTVKQLDNPSGSSMVECDAVSGKFAGCGILQTDDDDYIQTDGVLVPLSGGPVKVQTSQGSCGDLGGLTVVGKSLLWACGIPSIDNEKSRLVSRSAKRGSAKRSNLATGSAVVGAYGGAIVGSADGHGLLKAKSPLAISTLVTAKPSPVSVDTFALAPHRVMYADDQRIAGNPHARESAFRRTLRVRGARVVASRPQLLSRATHKLTGNLVGASNAISVWATATKVADHVEQANLQVLTSRHQVNVDGVIAQGVIQVSGSDVLFQRSRRSGGSTVDVYDASTGKTAVVQTVHGLDYIGFALSGQHVAYATNHGAIYWQSLKTGKRVQLAPALTNDVGGVEFSVYAYGDWVGWHASPVADELAAPLDRLRNVKTMAPAIALSHTLYSLSSAGALLDATATFRAGFTEAGAVPLATKFWLHPYHGHTRLLLGRSSYVAGPEIAGHLIAWAGPTGALRVKRLAS